MAIEKTPLNIDQDGSIDIEIMEQLAAEPMMAPQPTEVMLPEEMDIQGEMMSSFELDGQGNVSPLFGEEGSAMTDHQANLAETLDSSDLSTLASELLDAYDSDKDSRKDWLETFTKGLDLLGIKTTEREEPFPGATGVHHPLLAEAATQFQAQSYKELLPPESTCQRIYEL